MEVTGYGSQAELVSGILSISGKGLGRGGLGAAQRIIPVADIVAVAWRAPSVLTNGRLTIQSSVGISNISFLRKATTDAQAMYKALLRESGVDPETTPEGSLANERVQAWSDRAAERLRRAEEDALEAKANLKLERRRLYEEWRSNNTQFRKDLTEAVRGLADAGRLLGEIPSDIRSGVADARAQWTSDDARRIEAEVLEALLNAAEAPDGVAEDVDESEMVEADDRAVAFQRESADANDRPTVLQRVFALLDAAEVAAAGDNIVREERLLSTAAGIVKRHGKRGDRRALEAAVASREAAGKLRIGSNFLGVIRAESGFAQYARKQAFSKVVSGDKKLIVRSDRILAGGAVRVLDQFTRAQVYLDGQELVTQRPTLTRMLLLSPLPGSALIPGLAFQKKEKTDTRQGDFQVIGSGWSFRVPLEPNKLSEPRQIADQINRSAAEMAERHRSTAASQSPHQGNPADNVHNSGTEALIRQLERTEYLMSTGLLSKEEANNLKAAILG